jgi:hypothetical protein
MKVAEASGFNRDGVNQRAEEVRLRTDEFLLAVDVDKVIVANRELISAEIARVPNRTRLDAVGTVSASAAPNLSQSHSLYDLHGDPARVHNRRVRLPAVPLKTPRNNAPLRHRRFFDAGHAE